MKYISSIVFVAILATISSCVKQPAVPSTAITFGEDEITLKAKENNRLLSSENWRQLSPSSVLHTLKHDRFRYATDSGDTIQYCFSNNHLTAITIDINNSTYDDVIAYYTELSDTSLTDFNNHFIIDNCYIIVGERKKTQKPFTIILNDIDGEVSETVEEWKKLSSDGNDFSDLPNAEAYYITFIESKTGMLTGHLMFGNLAGQGDNSGKLLSRYYNKLILPLATDMAELESKRILETLK